MEFDAFIRHAERDVKSRSRASFAGRPRARQSTNGVWALPSTFAAATTTAQYATICPQMC
jgi:hypothetical protein